MKKFIEFLERNNAWEKFEKAFKEGNRSIKEYKATCRRFRNVEIDHAFDWEDTEEGALYWSRLSEKWIYENRTLKELLLSDD